jgi:hypothetical protein
MVALIATIGQLFCGMACVTSSVDARPQIQVDRSGAIIWVGICVIIFCLPFTPAAVPWRDEFDLKYFNYAPVTVGAVLLIVGLWWLISARKTFTGPVRAVEFDEGAGVQ